MSINWYPGHMAKSRRLMLEDLKNIDLVCEITDARIPKSSRNPDLVELSAGKRRIIVLNRADQADPAATARWLEFYRAQGSIVMQTNSQQGGFLPQFRETVFSACSDLIEKNSLKGQTGKNIRIMIVGIPNVGKSSFINRLLGKKAAIAADKPGVTRGKQWFSVPGAFDFMDMPGMLWPKIEDEAVGYALAFVGTIKDEILDPEDLACRLISVLGRHYPDVITARYGVDIREDELPFDTLEKMARARGFLLARGELDTLRMSKIFLNEFRGGKLGRLTLEYPHEE